MVSEAPRSLRVMSGRDDEWVTLVGRGQGGEGTAVGAGWRHRHEAGGALPWMVIVVVAKDHPCMAVGGGPSKEGG